MAWIAIWVCAIGIGAEEGIDEWNGKTLTEHVVIVNWCLYPKSWVFYTLDSEHIQELGDYGGMAWPDRRLAICRDKVTCAHELGHLLGLPHPNDADCQGGLAARPNFEGYLWDVVSPTIMDYSTRCPGMMEGVTEEDARLLRNAIR